ncbi:MAG: ribbon-helix-helix domain-containing protein [Gammaproteobacteria bacterium]|nr:ribbon-helix-helix domain-containing protein [Gammaproteobacteria bacterium]
MFSLRIPKELIQRLENLAEATGRSKAYYTKKALEKFLEDQEDYLLALAALEEEGPNISFEEVKRRAAQRSHTEKPKVGNRVQTKRGKAAR